MDIEGFKTKAFELKMEISCYSTNEYRLSNGRFIIAISQLDIIIRLKSWSM